MATATTPTKVSRSQTYKHQDFISWAISEGLMTATATPLEAISTFAANRGKWRKTPRYKNLRTAGDPAAAERKATRDAERAAKATASAAAKAAKAAEREAAKVAKAAAAPVKAAAKTTKAAAKKQAAAPTKAAAKKTTAAKKSAAAAPAGDNPFG